MKKALLVIMTILCMGGLSQAGWDEVATLSFANIYEKMLFVDTLQGWLVGGDDNRVIPYLAKSNNGGRSWTEQLVDSRLAYIWDIYFIDKNIGWMVGESKQNYGDSIGLVYKTDDGGSSWLLALEGKHIFRPRKIVFPSPTSGYFFSSSGIRGYKGEGYGTIGRTKDAGETWIIDTINGFKNRYFLDVHFINTDSGWAVGGDILGGNSAGFMLRTTNGGASWDSDSATGIISASELSSVFFVNGKKGWIGGRIRTPLNANALVAHTYDGSDTWVIQRDSTSIDYKYEAAIHKIHFFNDSMGWVVGLNRLYYTENGGMDWKITGFNSGYDNISKACFFDSKYAWLIIGTNDSKVKVYKTTDGGGYSQNVSITPNLRQKLQSSRPLKIRQSSTVNAMTNIGYELDRDAALSLSVYDLTGRKVAFLPQRFHAKGEHKFSVKIPKGFYIVEAKVYNGTKEVKYNEKILVR
jgi:photosystem II stability/assembly factor-like uncharacterized protein